jgi:hypothetical protein
MGSSGEGGYYCGTRRDDGYLVDWIGPLGLGGGGEVVVGAEHVVRAEVEAAGAAHGAPARGGAGAGHGGGARALARRACLEGKGRAVDGEQVRRGGRRRMFPSEKD